MSLGTIIKQNRVFIAGILLPVLLIALLALAKNIPLADPPQYKVVFWVKGWSDTGNLTARIKDDKHLEITFTKNKNFVPNTNYVGATPRSDIYIYSPLTNSLTDINIPLTVDDMQNEMKVLDIPQLADLEISSVTPSPDGYTFESYSYDHHSLITDIFSNNYNNGPALTKPGRTVRITPPNGYFGGSPEFIGWVTAGDKK